MYNNLLFINSVLYYHINKNLKLLVIALAIGHQSASAQITENFSWPLNSFSMEFVRVGNDGNLANTTKDMIYHAAPAYTDLIQGGAVGYTYDIGKTEVSRIMVEKVNAESFDKITMQDLSGLGGNGPNRPATGLSWYDAAKFVNELNRNQGYGIAYKTTGYTVPILSEWQPGEAGYNAANPLRNSTAKYFIASSDEWYKAAFYSPTKAAYNLYPQPDVNILAPPPTPVAGGTVGAVYGQAGPADVNNAGVLSDYGTMGQGGNAYEWTESGGRVEGGWWGSEIITYDFDYTGGYQWQMSGNTLVLEYVNGDWVPYYARDLDYYVAQEQTESLKQMGGLVLDLNDKTYATGFRVVSVNVPLTGGIPEPSALSLLAVGLGGLAVIRHRRS